MTASSDPQSPRHGRLGMLALSALGIVYGDIGTSPLYALQAVFTNRLHPIPVEPGNILGVLSLVLWSLLIVVTLKYVTLILRADNHDEGGIMALIALVRLFTAHPALAFFSLGLVVLAVTGVEALYADMGHFGRRPVRLAWLLLVLPALTLNYFGQGALLLTDPQAASDPFYRLAPHWALMPLVLLATIATVIASQAVISGAFSLTNQAIQLGYLPRVQVRHTSSRQRGQIYVPTINWLLFAAVVALVLGFGSAAALATAYGIAVTGTMSITTILVLVVARRRWRWGPARTLLVLGTLLAIDLTFFAANLPKLAAGGWFPLLIAALIFSLMSTWRQGRVLLLERLGQDSVSLADFVRGIETEGLPTVRGTAVYLAGHADQAPRAMLHSLKHFQCLHERIVVLHVAVLSKPSVPSQQRLEVEPLNHRFQRACLRFGFMDRPDVQDNIDLWQSRGMLCDPASTTFILGRETLLPTKGRPMAFWRQRLFIAVSRNARSRAAYFGLPLNRVVELGVQVSL